MAISQSVLVREKQTNLLFTSNGQAVLLGMSAADVHSPKSYPL